VKKLKVYLDTSVISHLDAPDTPEKMADTRRLWETIETHEYDVLLSTITLSELEKCVEPKLSILTGFFAADRIRCN
jgi:predicted nucleic acid-binding protein